MWQDPSFRWGDVYEEKRYIALAPLSGNHMPAPDTVISSAANPAIKQFRSLEHKKFREDTGLFMVEGLRYTLEMLLAGWEPVVVLAAPKLANDKALRSHLAGHRPHRHTVTPELLGRLAGRSNSEEVLVAFRQREADVTALAQGLWIALEEIRDPGNLGTIIRTAEAAGAAGVLLIGECCDVWAPEVVRASVGALARVPVLHLPRPAYLDWRKGYKGQVIATLMNARPDYREQKYSLPALLLMGSEHAGLSDAVAATCTASVRIPMQGKIESLNVATATALLAYEVMRAGAQAKPR